jgi:hypothetical protein
MSTESKLMREERYRGDLFRSYGPGKFNTYADAYIYDLSMDGADEEVGEAEHDNYHALIRGPFEHSQLREFAGAVIFVNSQGFVDVTFVEAKRELERDWKRIEKEVEKEMEEEEV